MSFNRDSVLVRIQKVFQQVFSLEPHNVTFSTSLANTQEWDSLQHMQLVISLESEFQTQFAMGEILQLQSVEQIIETLESKDIAS